MQNINPQEIKISDYNYELPDNRIAKYPLAKRDDSKLLIYKDSQIIDTKFNSIAEYLPENSLMIFNNTKVIHARLRFSKLTGANIEIFCLEPYKPHDYALILQATNSCVWKCMIGNAKKWKEGSLTKTISLKNKEIIILAKRVDSKESDLIEFDWDDDTITFGELLDIFGELPIPPYLNRKTEEVDNERYQTLYSKIEGSVAAPTAGLHFTDNVLNKIKTKGCTFDEVTLHVGAGTFKPVKNDSVSDHEMHSEFITVKKETIEKILNHKGKIVAVGTTSVRTLESLYYIGCLVAKDTHIADIAVSQWLPYGGKSKFETITKRESLEKILLYLNANKLECITANTQIIIVPGYQFKIVDAIVTNFHQPKSTLLLLVSAFVKGNWKTIYTHALAHEYRFLSYGDSSLLL